MLLDFLKSLKIKDKYKYYSLQNRAGLEFVRVIQYKELKYTINSKKWDKDLIAPHELKKYRELHDLYKHRLFFYDNLNNGTNFWWSKKEDIVNIEKGSVLDWRSGSKLDIQWGWNLESREKTLSTSKYLGVIKSDSNIRNNMFRQDLYKMYSKDEEVAKVGKRGIYSNIEADRYKAIKSKNMSERLLTPYYFFSRRYNEKGQPSQTRSWMSSVYNSIKKDKSSVHHLDIFTSKLINLFFRVKKIKRKYSWSRITLNGYILYEPKDLIDDLTKLIKYTSNRTTSYLRSMSEVPAVVLTDKWLKKQIEAVKVYRNKVKRRRTVYYGRFFPRRKQFMYLWSRVIISKPIFKHTPYNLIIDLFIFNNKHIQFAKLRNLLSRRIMYKYMYSMYVDYKYKIKETLSRPRFFYINLIQPKIFGYYYKILHKYEKYLIIQNKSLIVYLCIYLLKWSNINKKKLSLFGPSQAKKLLNKSLLKLQSNYSSKFFGIKKGQDKNQSGFQKSNKKLNKNFFNFKPKYFNLVGGKGGAWVNIRRLLNKNIYGYTYLINTITIRRRNVKVKNLNNNLGLQNKQKDKNNNIIVKNENSDLGLNNISKKTRHLYISQYKGTKLHIFQKLMGKKYTPVNKLLKYGNFRNINIYDKKKKVWDGPKIVIEDNKRKKKRKWLKNEDQKYKVGQPLPRLLKEKLIREGLQNKWEQPLDIKKLTLWDRTGLGPEVLKSPWGEKIGRKKFSRNKFSLAEFKKKIYYARGKIKRKVAPEIWDKKLESFYLYSKNQKQNRDSNRDEFINSDSILDIRERKREVLPDGKNIIRDLENLKKYRKKKGLTLSSDSPNMGSDNKKIKKWWKKMSKRKKYQNGREASNNFNSGVYQEGSQAEKRILLIKMEKDRQKERLEKWKSEGATHIEIFKPISKSTFNKQEYINNLITKKMDNTSKLFFDRYRYFYIIKSREIIDTNLNEDGFPISPISDDLPKFIDLSIPSHLGSLLVSPNTISKSSRFSVESTQSLPIEKILVELNDNKEVLGIESKNKVNKGNDLIHGDIRESSKKKISDDFILNLPTLLVNVNIGSIGMLPKKDISRFKGINFYKIKKYWLVKRQPKQVVELHKKNRNRSKKVINVLPIVNKVKKKRNIKVLWDKLDRSIINILGNMFRLSNKEKFYFKLLSFNKLLTKIKSLIENKNYPYQQYHSYLVVKEFYIVNRDVINNPMNHKESILDKGEINKEIMGINNYRYPYYNYIKEGKQDIWFLLNRASLRREKRNYIPYNENLFKVYYRYMIPLYIYQSYKSFMSYLGFNKIYIILKSRIFRNMKMLRNWNMIILNYIIVRTLLDMLQYNHRSLIKLKTKYYFINKSRYYMSKIRRLQYNTWFASVKYFRRLRKTPNRFWFRYHNVLSFYYKRVSQNAVLDAKRRIFLPFVFYFEDLLYIIYGKWGIVRLWPLKRFYLSSYLIAQRIQKLINHKLHKRHIKYTYFNSVRTFANLFRMLQIKRGYEYYLRSSNKWPRNLLDYMTEKKSNNYYNINSLNYNNLQYFMPKWEKSQYLSTYNIFFNDVSYYLSSVYYVYLKTLFATYKMTLTRKGRNYKLGKFVDSDTYLNNWLFPLNKYISDIKELKDIIGMKFVIAGRTGGRRSNARALYRINTYGNFLGPRHFNIKTEKTMNMYNPLIRNTFKANIDYDSHLAVTRNGTLNLKIWLSSIMATDVHELLLHLIRIKDLYNQIINRYYFLKSKFYYAQFFEVRLGVGLPSDILRFMEEEEEEEEEEKKEEEEEEKKEEIKKGEIPPVKYLNRLRRRFRHSRLVLKLEQKNSKNRMKIKLVKKKTIKKKELMYFYNKMDTGEKNNRIRNNEKNNRIGKYKNSKGIHNNKKQLENIMSNYSNKKSN